MNINNLYHRAERGADLLACGDDFDLAKAVRELIKEHRAMKDAAEPADMEQELWELTVKAGRRCAYDLKHTTDFIQEDPEFRDNMRNRAEHWLRIFDSAGGPKDYRTRLGANLTNALSDVERLRNQLKAAGIEPCTPDRSLPF